MRSAALAAIVALVASLLPLLVASPAGARLQKELVVRTGNGVKQSYDAIPGSAPLDAEEVEPAPDDCMGTGPFQGACDVVPIRILIPEGITDSDDWSVTLTLDWTGTADEVDMYFYDNRQITRRTNPDATDYTLLGKSKALKPEVVKVFKPDLGEYNLVVLHFAGSNTGYTVSGKITVGEPFQSPFESIGGPGGGRSGSGPKDEAEARPVDRSDESSPAFAQTSDTAAGRTLGTVAIMPDSDLDAFDLANFGEQLAAPVLPLNLPPGLRASSSRPGPVPAIVLLFWFAIVPFALLGSLFYLVVRRNRAAFSFG